MSRVPIEITDPADPRMSAFRDIRERDLVGRKGQFIAEGRLVVGSLLTGTRFRARAVLVSPAALSSIEPELDQALNEPEVYVAPVDVMSAIAGFHIHRGCLAIGERLEALTAQQLIAPPGEPSLLVALEELSNHDNVGSVFRNASAFGVSGVLLSPRCCDPLYRKAIRVSMAGALRVPFARSERWHEDLDQLNANGYQTVALVTDPDALDIGDHVRACAERIALLVGAEGPGLDPKTVERCNAKVRIPMGGEIDSLNAGVACAIALHRYREAIGRAGD